MEKITIRLGVNAPSKEVDVVLRVLDYIYEQNPESDTESFIFMAEEEDLNNSAAGIMAAMSFVRTETREDGQKEIEECCLIKRFDRITRGEKSAILMEIPSRARQMVRMIYEKKKEEEGKD